MTTDDRLQQLGDHLERAVASDARARRREARDARHVPTWSSRRRVTIGVAAAGLAAAAAVAVVAIGSGSDAGPASPGSSAVLSVPGGPARGEDAAYIIRRVKTRVADGDLADVVYHAFSYPSGQMAADGTLSETGSISGDGYTYVTADGTQYGAGYIGGGPASSGFGVIHAPANGEVQDSQTQIDNVDRTYSEQTTESPDPSNAPSPSPASGVSSGPAAVRQALRDGQVTQIGTTTIGGTPAVALALTPTPGTHVQRQALYVDAQTDQPLRMAFVVTDADGGRYAPGLYVTDWLPATSANVAMAEFDTVPAGYTKVANAAPRG